MVTLPESDVASLETEGSGQGHVAALLDDDDPSEDLEAGEEEEELTLHQLSLHLLDHAQGDHFKAAAYVKALLAAAPTPKARALVGRLATAAGSQALVATPGLGTEAIL